MKIKGIVLCFRTTAISTVQLLGIIQNWERVLHSGKAVFSVWVSYCLMIAI